VGSFFTFKKATKAPPKIQIDDDSELIDEDSLLTEEGLKKPQLPVGTIINPSTYFDICKDIQFKFRS
jgi:hypothetical protein